MSFQIIKLSSTIKFMKLRMTALVFSAILLIASIGSLVVNQLNWGLDFTGGTVVQMKYPDGANLESIRTELASDNNEYQFPDAVVQNFGSSQDVIIRVAPRDDIPKETIGDEVVDILIAATPSATRDRIEFVGPNVGEELTEQGGLAMLVALICILIYVAMRFEWRFALGSVAALAHDVIIVLGLFSILQLEFDLTVLAALLAVIGYSLNDTIVVSDRIRENFRKVRKGSPSEIIDISLTQTLNRTLVTSLTTILVLLALFFKGGALIHGFATALLMGVFIGTYSSIYVASSVALALGISKEDLMPPEIEKEGEDLDTL
ncbi:MAG: protein translocase subunit SecF [Pseudomonadota bacterium]